MHRYIIYIKRKAKNYSKALKQVGHPNIRSLVALKQTGHFSKKKSLRGSRIKLGEHYHRPCQSLGPRQSKPQPEQLEPLRPP